VTSTPTPLPELSALDRQAVDALWSFGPEPGRLLRQMIIDFRSEAPADFNRLTAAATAGDDAAVAALAHRLKGTCSNMGAKRLAAACATIRLSALEHSESGIAEAVAAGRMELDRALADVQRLSDSTASPTEPATLCRDEPS
jgi:HPt (histidine-containing phosphotransfer) domain-containing protein